MPVLPCRSRTDFLDRDRKIRCSREIPCEQCIKRGDEDTCVVEHFKHRAEEERQARERQEALAAARASSEQYLQSLHDTILQLKNSSEAQRRRIHELEESLQHARDARPEAPHKVSSGATTLAADSRGVVQEFQRIQNHLAQLASRLPPDQAYLAALPIRAAPAVASEPMMDKSESEPYVSAPALPLYSSQGNNDSNPSCVKVPTDAEDAVSMLETLVNAPHPSAPRPKNRLMAMSRLVHEHNTTLHRSRSQTCSSPDIKGFCGRISTENSQQFPQSSRGRADSTFCGHGRVESTRLAKADDSSPSAHSVRSSSYAYSSAETPPTEADSEDTRHPLRDSEAGYMPYLGARHKGLVKVYNGSETKLGFGVGWTFAAAAERGEFEEIRRSFTAAGKDLGDGQAEREAILRTALRTLPIQETIVRLIDSYNERANFIHTRPVHAGQLKRELNQLYTCSDEKARAHVLNELDPGWLALLLVVLAVGLKFYPVPDAERDSERLSLNLLNASCTINCWYSSAKTILSMLDWGMTQPSLSMVQAFIVIDVHGAEDEPTLEWLQKTAIHAARVLGIDRLGAQPVASSEGADSESEQEVNLRYEMGKRVWWSLVSRDWYASQILGLVYNIVPDQFSTPKPGNYSDEDLLQESVPAPRPTDQYTESSYALARAALSTTIRRHTDLINRRAAETSISRFTVRLSPEDVNRLDASYRSLLEVEFPPFYRMKEHTTPCPSVVMERALLHNIIFSQLLRLHRFSLSSRPDEMMGVGGRDTCVLLARCLLNSLSTLQQGITAVGRLWCLRGHLFQASAVLVLDLCRRPQSPADRSEIRKEVMTAVMALRVVLHYNPPVKRALRILLALLAEEDAQWKERQAGAPSLDPRINPQSVPLQPRLGTDTMVSLAMRIKEVISQHHNSELAPGESEEMQKALAYVSSTADADLAYTASEASSPGGNSSSASWFSLPPTFGARNLPICSNSGTEAPDSCMSGRMPNLGWFRPSETLVPPLALDRVSSIPPPDGMRPSCPSISADTSGSLTSSPPGGTSASSHNRTSVPFLVPPPPLSLWGIPGTSSSATAAGSTVLSGPLVSLGQEAELHPMRAAHLLFHPGQRTQDESGSYDSLLSNAALVVPGDDFSLSAFLSRQNGMDYSNNANSGAPLTAPTVPGPLDDSLAARVKHSPDPGLAPAEQSAKERISLNDAFWRWVMDQGSV